MDVVGIEDTIEDSLISNMSPSVVDRVIRSDQDDTVSGKEPVVVHSEADGNPTGTAGSDLKGGSSSPISTSDTVAHADDSTEHTRIEQQEDIDQGIAHANDVCASGFIQSFASTSVDDSGTDSGMYYGREWPSNDSASVRSSITENKSTYGSSTSKESKDRTDQDVVSGAAKGDAESNTNTAPPRPTTEAPYSHTTQNKTHNKSRNSTNAYQNTSSNNNNNNKNNIEHSSTEDRKTHAPVGISISSESSVSDQHTTAKTIDALHPHTRTGSITSGRDYSVDSNLQDNAETKSSSAKDIDVRNEPVLIRDGNASVSKLVESVINKDGYLATTRTPHTSPIVLSSEGNTTDYGTDHGEPYQPSLSTPQKRFHPRKPTTPYSVSLPRMSDGLQEITLHRRATGDRFGLTLSKVAHCLYVVCVRPGFLAYQAGMRFGDQIVSINGVDTFDLDVMAATDLINGGALPTTPPPSPVPGPHTAGNHGNQESAKQSETSAPLSRNHSTDSGLTGGRLSRKQSTGVNVLTFSSKANESQDQSNVAPPQLRGINLPEKSGYQYFSRNNTSQMNLGLHVAVPDSVASTEPSPAQSPIVSPRNGKKPVKVKALQSVKDVKCVLGVHFQPDVRTCTVPLYKTTNIGISVRKGCVVKLVPGSPAATSGIMKGDVIIDVNGYCAIGKRRHEIYHMISTNDPGTIVMIQVMPESKFRILTTVLDPKTLGKLMSY